MRYLNLDVFIGSATGQGYSVRAASTLGQVSGVCVLNPATPEMSAILDAIARGRAERADLLKLGQQLADSLLTGGVENLFQRTLGAAQGQADTGVRIRLRIEPPELAALPWELLWTGADPLVVSTRNVLTRFIDLDIPMRALTAPQPLRMLGLIPQGSGVDTEKEKAALIEALSALGDALKIEWLEGMVTRDRIRNALGQSDVHLIHFLGHGGVVNGQLGLRLNDDYGDEYYIPAASFAGFFRDRASVRLILLNACQGAAVSAANAMLGIAPQIVRQGLPAVVAMQWEIHAWAAQQFAQAFYRSLCVGPEAGEVDTAVTRGRAVLYDDSPDSRAFATPVLFLRADEGRLWETTSKEKKKMSDKDERDDDDGGGGVRFGGGNVTIGGDVAGRDMHKGTTINTGGGAYVGGSVTAGGDFVGRDQTKTTGLSAAEVKALFDQLYAAVDNRPNTSPQDKEDLKTEIQDVQAEVAKGEKADETFLARRLRNIQRMAPDILQVVTATLANPAAGFGMVIKKVTDRMSQSAGG